MAFSTLQSRLRSKTIISGIIIGAVDANVYKVRFQNGKEIECDSCKLKVFSNEYIPPSFRQSNSINDDNDTDSESVSQDASAGRNQDDDDDDDDDVEDDNEDDAPPNSQDPVPDVAIANVDETPDVDTSTLSYFEKLARLRQKVRDLTGDTVEMKKYNSRIIWTMIENHICDNHERTDDHIGLKPHLLKEVCNDPTMIASEIFLRLMFGGSMVETIVKMNHTIQDFNEKNTHNVSICSTAEFFGGITMLIGSVCFLTSGNQLWNKVFDEQSNGWVSLEPSADFHKWMRKF